MDYIKELNKYILAYLNSSSTETATMLERNLSLLKSAVEVNDLDLKDLTTTNFFTNLHHLMSNVSPNTEIFWKCIAIIQTCNKDSFTRKQFVDNYRFIPILVKHLEKLESHDKINRMLTLLQDLTYGIRITCQEPYLELFVQLLVDFIYNDDDIFKILALSILVNICYHNLPTINFLLKIVHVKTFIEKIKNKSILSSKMCLILTNSQDFISTNDLHCFMKTIFIDIDKCLRETNIPFLKHIVDFLWYTNDSDNYFNKDIIIKYPDFYNNVSQLINNLEQFCSHNVETENAINGNRRTCISLIFEFLFEIIELDTDILNPLYETILQFVLKVINNGDDIGARSLNIIRIIVQRVENNNSAEYMANILNIIVPQYSKDIGLNSISERNISFIKLLMEIMKNHYLQIIVKNIISETYFENILKRLCNMNCSEIQGLSVSDTIFYIYSLSGSIAYRNLSSNVLSNFINILNMKTVQLIIAKAILSENEDLCNIVFDLSKISDFPGKEISKLMVKQVPLLNANITSMQVISSIDYYPLHINKSLESRIDSLVSYISDCKDRKEINSLNMSDIIELYEYKMNLNNSIKKDLQKQLNDASNLITNLSHRITILISEITKYKNLHYSLILDKECLQKEINSLVKSHEALQLSINEFYKKLEHEKLKSEQINKKMELKQIEIKSLLKEMETYRDREQLHKKEIKQLELNLIEINGRNDEFRKNLKIYEESTKQKQKKLEHKEKENEIAKKQIDDMKKANLNNENLIKDLEGQIIEKNAAIVRLESEINETEELRNTVLSLMQSKTLKRKN